MALSDPNRSDLRNGSGSPPQQTSDQASVPPTQPHFIPDVAESPRTSEKSSGNGRPQNQPNGGPVQPTWPVQPPTAPRSMRSKITPPPPRRADTYRPPERRFQHDLYRPSSHRYGDEAFYESRASASDCYRPPAPRYTDDFREGQRVSTGREARRESGQEWTDDMRLESGPPRQNGCDSESGKGNGPRAEKNKTVPANGSGIPDDGGRENQRQDGSLLRLASCGDPGTGDWTQNAANASSHTAPRLPNSPPLPVISAAADHGVLDTIEKQSVVEPPDDTPFLKAHRDMINFCASRLSNEETASTSSTTTSRSRNFCRACGVSGNHVTPLVPCSRCRKGYHDRCGNPKPQQSPNLDDFVCGQCLRKQERERAERDHSRRNSLDRYSPMDTPNPPKEPSNQDHSDGNNKGTITEDTHSLRPQSSNLTMDHQPEASNRMVPEEMAAQGTLYKHITCPFWKHDGCYLFEGHCLYAHKETGRDAPYGNQPAKDFTCSRWRNGTCLRNPNDCLYAHKDTGLYLGPDCHPSRKHITCYYWKFHAQCNKRDEDCPFAHHPTGTVAFQPLKESISIPGNNSLREYICPRWQASYKCQFHKHGCPYMHSFGGKSCFSLNNLSEARQARESQSGTFSTHSLSAGSIPNQSAIPPWVQSTQHTPILVAQARTAVNEDLHAAVNKPEQSILPTAKSATNSPFWSGVPASSLPTGPEEQPPKPIKHMARRSAISFDPRKNRKQPRAENPASTHSTQDECPPSLHTESQSSSSGVASDTNASNGETSETTAVTGARKHCDVCHKAILGSSSRCVKCSTPEEKRAAADSGCSASAADANVIDDDLFFIASQSKKQTQDSQDQTSSATLQQYLVANTLKRTAPEDRLFVPKKRPKVAQLSLDQAAHSLRQPIQKESVTINREANQVQKKASLEELTRLARLEIKTTRERFSTSASKTTQAVLQDSRVKHSNVQASGFQDPDSPHQREGRLAISTESLPGRDRSVSNSLSAFSGLALSGLLSTSNGPSTSRGISNSNGLLQPAYEVEAETPVILYPADTESSSVGDKNGATPTEQVSHRLVAESDFTEEEETLFRDAYARNPKSWTKIAECLPGRTQHDCIRHYHSTRLRANYEWVAGGHPLQDKQWTFIDESTAKNRTPVSKKFVRENGDKHPEKEPAPLSNNVVQAGSLVPVDSVRSPHSKISPMPPELCISMASHREEDVLLDTIFDRADDVMFDNDSDREGDLMLEKSSNIPVEEVQEDVPNPTRLSPFGQATMTPGPSRFAVETEDDNDVRLAQRRRIESTKQGRRQVTLLSPPVQRTEGHTKSPKQPRKSGQMDLPNSEAPNSLTTIEMEQPVWSKDDEQRAMAKLRARGVRFESDSESEEDVDDDLNWFAPQRPIDPLWQPPQKSSNLFDIDPKLDLRDSDNLVAALQLLQPRQKNAPSKKQMVGNLLKYQCRDHRRKFGNPHQEVERHIEGVEVTVVVQCQTRPATPDPFAVDRFEKKKVTTTFQEFIGVPEEPIIDLGRNKDELVFREGKTDRVKNPRRPSRPRRVTDDEKFPFLYSK
ncbi:uncharacterized protein Z518_01077 [Rhinocladiella mackenziei CBS 650.93]|uniref:Uncharacterized protein n=1 Tax=Rhinocladiella mackenziei CBS 650.93 TaxID=1442369 RepID=A0A0D2J2X8_9EURO|nr:uncharacterized protein Z518_01077 [Rhinocladiella mackenziei CBS 650.93]KIX09996.1 hypothetical protein Z518_01077 [Rhinocladiella mackenziei CBS 650.93]